ncbi:MAG: hypothetical protein WCG27_00310 [Pseudomonadota bacterium]
MPLHKRFALLYGLCYAAFFALRFVVRFIIIFLFLLPGLAIPMPTPTPTPFLAGADSPDLKQCFENQKQALLWTGLPLARNKNGAKAANTLGMEVYRTNDLFRAAWFFSCATQLDPGHALAHYNLACVLARWTDADASAFKEISNHLGTAIRLDPKRKERARVDPDLSSVRGRAVFMIDVQGIDITRPEGISKLLNPGPRLSNEDECGGGMFENNLIFTKEKKILHGCANDGTRKTLAAAYRIEGDRLILTGATDKISNLKIVYQDFELKILGLDKDGKTVSTWSEYSGYYGEL